MTGVLNRFEISHSTISSESGPFPRGAHFAERALLRCLGPRGSAEEELPSSLGKVLQPCPWSFLYVAPECLPGSSGIPHPSPIAFLVVLLAPSICGSMEAVRGFLHLISK